MKKENLLILTVITASLLFATRLVFQKTVLTISKKESAHALQEETQQSLGTIYGFVKPGKISAKLIKVQNDNTDRKIASKLNKLQLAIQTPAISKNSGISLDKNKDAAKQEIFNYVSEVHYQLEKQDEFLKLKVGLSNEQIKMVHTKNVIFQKKIEFAKILAIKKSASAKRFKMMILVEHSDWMTYVLGAENFAEYMQIAPKSYGSGTNEI